VCAHRCVVRSNGISSRLCDTGVHVHKAESYLLRNHVNIVRHPLRGLVKIVLARPTLPELLKVPWVALTQRRFKVIAGPASERAEDLATMAELVASGWYTPVIDRSFSFDQMVEAHRYVDSGRKSGSVVVILN
jgi:NADPH:quinone reductase-like Zn-dependent oxidoreductase